MSNTKKLRKGRKARPSRGSCGVAPCRSKCSRRSCFPAASMSSSLLFFAVFLSEGLTRVRAKSADGGDRTPMGYPIPNKFCRHARLNSLNHAAGETRTLKSLRTLGPKPNAYANSATTAKFLRDASANSATSAAETCQKSNMYFTLVYPSTEIQGNARARLASPARPASLNVLRLIRRNSDPRTPFAFSPQKIKTTVDNQIMSRPRLERVAPRVTACLPQTNGSQLGRSPKGLCPYGPLLLRFASQIKAKRQGCYPESAGEPFPRTPFAFSPQKIKTTVDNQIMSRPRLERGTPALKGRCSTK